MPIKDPEKRKEWAKQYYIKTKEKRQQYKKDNPYIRSQQSTINNAVWQKSKAGVKSYTKANWRQRNVFDNYNDNYETLYKIYISTKFCDNCGYILNKESNTLRKCLDHEHSTGYFRGVLCHSCNVRMK